MKLIRQCPVCNGAGFTPFLECEDYTVSHETFQLVSCNECGFVFTNPRPDDHDLPRYYESDAYISHATKSKTLFDRVYKISRTFTIKRKYRLVQKYSVTPAHSILDYGCGTGTFLVECLKHGMTVKGVEPSDSARNSALAHTGAIIANTIQNISGRFDIITLWHVLEHVADLKQTLLSLRDRLTENGTLFIAVPNLKSLDATIYHKHWAAYDVPRHLWHFSRESMRRLLSGNGLKLHNILPMKLDAFYVSLLSEKYKGNASAPSAITTALVNGFRSNHLAGTTQEYSSLIYIARK